MEFYLLLDYVKIRFKKGEKKVLHKKGRRHLRDITGLLLFF